MKRLIFLCLFLLISWSAIAFEGRVISRTNNVNGTFARDSLRIYQAESITYNSWSTNAAGAIDLTGSNVSPVWYWVSPTNDTLVFMVATGTVVNATNGQVQVLVHPTNSTVKAQRYYAYLRAYDEIGGTNRFIGTLGADYLDVQAAMDAGGYALAAPIDMGTLVQSNQMGAGATWDGAQWTFSTVGGGPLLPYYFTFTTSTFVATSLIGIDTPAISTNEDRIESAITTYVHRAIQIVPDVLYSSNAVTVTSTATNIIIDNELLQIRFTENTTADVTLTLGNYTRSASLASSAINNYTNLFIYTGITGSLRYAMTDGFDSSLTADDTAVYSILEHSTTNYIRNTNCWAYGLMDLSCASPWNSYGAGCRGGTVVTPQHIIYAKHYAMPTGTVLRFVDATNTVIERTLVDYRYPALDCAVGKLSSPLPPSIVPAKILQNYTLTDYLPVPPGADARITGGSYQIPAVFLSSFEQIYCGEWSTGITVEYVYISELHTNRSARYRLPVGGDSGNPVLLKAGTNTVLLACWQTAQSGTSLKFHSIEIDAALVAMGGAHTSLLYLNNLNYLQVATNSPPAP